MKTMILYTIWLRTCKMSKKQRNVLKKYLLKAMCFKKISNLENDIQNKFDKYLIPYINK